MIQKTSILLLYILLLSNWSFGQQKAYLVNAIAFYNVENLFDTLDDPIINDADFLPNGSYNYTEKIYLKKLQNLEKVFQSLATDKESKYNIPGGPAIIGLAEIENKQVIEALINQSGLKARNYQIVHFNSPDYRGVDVALIYRPDLFQIIAAQSLYVDIAKQEKAERTRDILMVSGILGGDTVHVFVNHWPSRRGGEAASMWKRKKAADIVKNKVDSLTKLNENVKIVIMGDFNDDPVSASITKNLGAIGDKQKAIDQKALYNPWLNYYKNGVGTLGYNDSWNLFDQIIVSYGLTNNNTKGWRIHSTEIFNRTFLTSQFGKFKGYPHRSFSGSQWIDGFSDHYPTIIYLIKEQ